MCILKTWKLSDIKIFSIISEDSKLCGRSYMNIFQMAY